MGAWRGTKGRWGAPERLLGEDDGEAGGVGEGHGVSWRVPEGVDGVRPEGCVGVKGMWWARHGRGLRRAEKQDQEAVEKIPSRTVRMLNMRMEVVSVREWRELKSEQACADVERRAGAATRGGTRLIWRRGT